MNRLEALAIEKIRDDVFSIIDRCHEKNAGRLEHERMYIIADAKRLLEKVNALIENDPELKKKYQ